MEYISDTLPMPASLPGIWEKSLYVENKAISTAPDIGDDYDYVVVDGQLVKKSETSSRLSSNVNAVVSFINQMVSSAKLSDHFIIEGITPPNELCKDKTKDVAKKLFSVHGLIPNSIKASAEEGLLMHYWDSDIRRSLKIEVYNDILSAGIVSEDTGVLFALDVETSSDVKELVKQYKG